MAIRQSIPDIKASAFSTARKKCAMSVEELAHLACLSKKQIQQIENGGFDSFYSPTIKFNAAKKVANLIKLDEKDAFDFGPQAESAIAPAAEVIQNESASAELPLFLEQANEPPTKEVLKKEGKPAEVRKVITRKRKADAELTTPSQSDSKPSFVQAPKLEPIKRTHTGAYQQKPSGKKWFWLLPVGALVVALVQFQPLLQDQLDALMGQQKPIETTPVPSAALAEPVPASPPAEPASTTAAATPQVAPVIIASPVVAVAANPACPLPDPSIENYKSPSANKPGNMVFVKMPTAQTICVEDGDGKVQIRAMDPSLGHSFYGKPPFKLLTSGLSSAEVFFQGLRVRPSAPDAKTILLIQAD